MKLHFNKFLMLIERENDGKEDILVFLFDPLRFS